MADLSLERFFDEVPEPRRVAEKAGIDEIEKRPEIAEVVFHRGAGEGDAGLGLEHFYRFALAGGGFLMAWASSRIDPAPAVAAGQSRRATMP
jgi:hypothetical protein